MDVRFAALLSKSADVGRRLGRLVMRHIQDILVLLGCLAVLHASDDGEEAREFHGGVGCPCIEVDHAALSAQFPESNIEVDDAAGCLRAPRSAEGVGATRTYVRPTR